MQNDNPASDYVNSYQPPSNNQGGQVSQPQTYQPQSQPPSQPQTGGVNDNSGRSDASSSVSQTDEILRSMNALLDEDQARRLNQAASASSSDSQSAPERQQSPAAQAGQTSQPISELNQDVEINQVPVSSQPPAKTNANREATQPLENENIFFLLGAEDGKEDDKEQFLDELQQVIWEDFVENDVELLLTSDELAQFNQIKGQGDSRDLQVQEKLLKFLENLIPDLEDIMLEKALELKEDLVRERVTGMREYYAGNENALQQIQQAENLMNQDKWHDAAGILNSVT